MTTEQTVEMQAKLFVFDLNNCAREFGFKADDVWEISLATQAEKTTIEKDYYPTITAKVSPASILEMVELVKAKVAFVKLAVERNVEDQNLPENILQYVVAFIPERKRQ